MADAPYWDPYNEAQRRDPYEAWRRLRDEAPVYRNETYGFYALSRFADVYEASLDSERFSSTGGTALDMIGRPLDPMAASMMIHMDPPRHDAFRKVVSRAYTPRRIADLEQRIRDLCARYLDPFVGSDGFDYVRDFSMKLPVMVISTLLGFPEQDHDQLREWSDAMLVREEGKAGSPEAAREAQIAQFGYLAGFVAAKRADPDDGFVSALLEAELDDPERGLRPLDDIEIMGMVALISSAGNETVARLLGWAALVLAANPDQRAQLVADGSLVPNAVEELLRYEAPSPTQGRMTLTDVTLHGTTIPAGSPVALLTGSAGRDPRAYEDADRFDVRRRIERHVSLGYGAHYCLGAALARMEGRVAIDETLRRFPAWEVDPAAVTLVETNTVRGPASCPIAL
jgi:cytochrome P450